MSNITEYQQKIIDLAQEVLKPYNKEHISYTYYYFENKKEEEYGAEHDCCDDEKCIEAEAKSLRKEYGSFNVFPRYSSNGRTSDSIDRCCQCSRPLSEFLCDVEQEFNHHKKYSKTKDDFTSNALEIIAVLYGFHASDSSINYFDKLNKVRYDKALKEQKKEIQSMVRFAKKIIDAVFPLTEQEINDIECIGGLYTIKEERITNDIYRARYLNEVNGKTLWKKCFLLDNDYHAETLSLAESEKRQRINKKESEIQSKKQYEKNLKLKYYYRDARKAGNCKEGIQNFIEKAKLDKKKGYTGEFLMKVAERYNLTSYVDRMIKQKIK